MAKPEINQKAPFVIECEPGEYWWCACGKSENQPWCDGSHEGTGIEPIHTVVEEKRRYAWCGCKHSGKNPFCDGSHKKL